MDRLVLFNPFFWLDLWRALWCPYVEPAKRDLQRENYELREANGILRDRQIQKGLEAGAGSPYVGKK